MATGVRQRHGLNCNRKGRCDCPWEASVYSKRDAKKIRKTFPTKAAAVAWRDDSRSAVRKGSMSAPTAITITEAADAWIARARAGTSLTRSGDPYKPSALRAYADAMRLRVNPVIGSMRLSEVRAIDLKQLLVNPLIAERSQRVERRRHAVAAQGDLPGGDRGRRRGRQPHVGP
jgi:integrase